MGILFAIATTISTIPAAPLTPRELLERGIRQEVITADIDAAIISYKDALAHKDIGPHTKLEATLRLAGRQHALHASRTSCLPPLAYFVFMYNISIYVYMFIRITIT